MNRLKCGPRSGSILIALLFHVTLLALQTQAIPDSEIQKRRVSMATIFYGRLPSAPLRTMDFVLTPDGDGTPLVTGRSKTGKKWRITLPPAIRGLWMVRRMGIRTYYFAGYTGGAGMAPDTWILAVSFDEHGLPIPFHVRSYAGYDANGIKDLLDLDGSGPILLQQTWLESHWMPNQRSGYFITSAYRQHGAYWHRADGPEGAWSFPVFEKWVDLPNTRPEPVRAPDFISKRNADYGNDPRSGVQTMITGVTEHGIHTGTELGCELEFIDVVVLDSPLGRRIEAGYFYAGSTGSLLPEIARHQSLATFTGLDRWPDKKACTPSIAWATF